MKAQPALLKPILCKLKQTIISVHHTGSCEICNPAPTDTDDDWFIQVADQHELIAETHKILMDAGFSYDGGDHYQNMIANDFLSFSRAPLNLLFSANPTFTIKHKAATAFCKRLNVMAKPDRIKIFRNFLYGEALT